jgi:hypothetical protein
MVAESFLRHAPADGSAPQGTIGSVQLRYHSLQLVPVDLVDDLPGIWHALLEAVEGYLADGSSEVPYPSIEANILLTGTGSIAKFTVGKVRHIVDAGELVEGILGGAADYFGFASGAQDEPIARIGRLRTRVAAAGLSA